MKPTERDASAAAGRSTTTCEMAGSNMLALGGYWFSLDTAAYQELQRTTA